MNRDIQQRLTCVRLYEESGDAGFVCRRCGISRPTLKRYFELSEETPFSNEVSSQYQSSKERIQEANYRLDLRLAKLKPSL